MKVPSQQLILIMGVSGSGKTTVAKKLSGLIHGHYLDADDFHSVQARQQMATGQPLNDQQRGPWIATMLNHLNSIKNTQQPIVLAYSGLKRKHRQAFYRLPFKVHRIMLSLPFEQLKPRLEHRQGHFFSTELLASQFAALEYSDKQEAVQVIDASQSINAITVDIINALTSQP
jgi:gluconokinase